MHGLSLPNVYFPLSPYVYAQKREAVRKQNRTNGGRMSNNKRGTMSREKMRDNDEVEELLRAAEDDMLLKLSLNAHLARTSSSSSPLDSDLARRFEALKSPSVPSGFTTVPLAPRQQKEKQKDEEEVERVLGDDLSARFAALRGSLYASSSPSIEFQVYPVKSDAGCDVDDDDKDDDGTSKSEVDKVIQWAMDAARLDPSPTDDDDDDDDDDEELEQEDLDGGRRQQKKK